MTLIEARIILRKRKECIARLRKYGENCGRCSPCPLRTSLDDYIEARRVIDEQENVSENGCGAPTVKQSN